MMKKFAVMLTVICLLVLSAAAAEPVPDSGFLCVNDPSLPRVIDEAELLSEKEQAALLDIIRAVSNERSFDIVIATVNSTDGKTAMNYADDLYDYSGYGVGDNADGVLLLVDMGGREWWISTTGYGIDVFPSQVIDLIGSELTQYLTAGEYFSYFSGFVSMCDSYLNRAEDGYITDSYIDDPGADIHDIVEYQPVSSTVEENKTGLVIGVGLGGGLLIALIVTAIFKGQLKSVRRQPLASAYEREGSFKLTLQRDVFLYNTLSKTKRAENNTGSGGSGGGLHVGSSGRSHGGGGGRF